LLYQRGEDDSDEEEEEDEMQDDDADIMELINGQGENDELLKQLQGEMEDGGDDQYYFEHQDGEGNVYLMDPHEDVLPEDNADFANMVQ